MTCILTGERRPLRRSRKGILRSLGGGEAVTGRKAEIAAFLPVFAKAGDGSGLPHYREEPEAMGWDKGEPAAKAGNPQTGIGRKKDPNYLKKKEKLLRILGFWGIRKFC